MNDTANASAAPAGTDASASAAATTIGSPAAAAPDTFAGLQNAESRAWVGSKGFKGLDPLVESARHADRLQTEMADLKSKALTPPPPDAKPEDWQAFYAKLGRPETADGYEFKLPEGLPPDMPYDSESAKASKAWFHEAGLAPRQAQALHDAYVKHAAEQHAAALAALKGRGETAHGELTKAWGAPDSDGYKTNVQHLNRFIDNNGGETLLSEMKSAGVLSQDGVVLAPTLAKAMSAAGAALYREDQLVSGSGVSGANPYASGSENVTEQMRMWRADPNRARAFMTAAGKRPSDYGLT